MTRHRATLRGRIFQTPSSARHRLRDVRDLLDLLYAEKLSAAQWQKELWAWYAGVHAARTGRLRPRSWKRLMRETEAWDWPGIRRRLPEAIDTILGAVRGEGGRFGITVPRVLTEWKAPDGKSYFHYSADVVPPLDQVMLEGQVIETMLSDLSGLNIECIGRCTECHRYFARERPTRSQYCSTRCRNLGYLKAHGFRRSKGRKREVA